MRFLLSLSLIVVLGVTSAIAQPPARRRQQAALQENSAQPKASAYREFPTAQSMPTDADWRRDLYLTLDLTNEANAPLYYPTVPQGGRMNLFTYIFKLVLRGQVKAYDYKLDGFEDFSEGNVVKAKEIMDRYHIFYESKDGRMRVNDADLPSDEVKVFFVKQSVYYDQHNASFSHKIEALCPVLKRGDDEFSGTDSQYPMFWVKYDDVAPYLGKLMLMSSSLNNAAMMSADDFFTLGRYKGDIYIATNLQNRILANYCPTDSALTKERNRIAREIVDFEDHVYGRDSVAMAKAAAEQAKADSIAAAEAALKKSSRRSRTRGVTSRRITTASKAEEKEEEAKPAQAKVKRQRARNSGGSSSRGTFSARRQRH